MDEDMRKKGIAKDLRFLEVSLVKTPACAEARIEVLSKLLNGNVYLDKIKKEENSMAEKKIETQPETKTEEVNPISQLAEAIKQLSEKLDSAITKIDKLGESVTKAQEAPPAEPEPAPAPEPEPEPAAPAEPEAPAEPKAEEVEKKVEEQKETIEQQKARIEKLEKALEEIKKEPVLTPVTTVEKKPITGDEADNKFMEFLQARGA
jgi:methyl-accepting chemotaxis protein